MTSVRTPVAFALLGAFIALLAAYVVLTLNGQDATGLLDWVLVFLAAVGLGGHQEMRLRSQDKTLAKIDGQTNGVLTARIREGATEAVEEVLSRIGYTVPPKD